MNLGIVEKVVQYVEENYHNEVSNEIVEKITGKSSGYVRNEFKRIVKISIDEYRVKRELSLIIQEIKDLNLSIKNSNLLPWNTENSFSKSFKSNFNESPMKFIKHYDARKLYPKFDVEKFKNSYDNDTKIIDGLTRKLGNKTKALRYVLSLRPYAFNPMCKFFLLKETDIKDIIIKEKYSQEIKQRFFTGRVPREFYNYYSKLLDKYYDMEKSIIFNQFNNEDIFFSKQYVAVKKSIIYRLLKDTELDSIINYKTNPRNLVTLWYDEIKGETNEKHMCLMPRELANSGIGMMEWAILNNLLIQEQGFREYRTIYEFRDEIEYDYCKPIDKYSEYCNKCDYKGECDEDSDCLIDRLSEKEKAEFEAKPDYEVLTMERLCEEIKKLIIERLVYFDCYE